MSCPSSSPLFVPARCSGLWRAALWAALGVAAPSLAFAGVAGVVTTTVTTLSTNVTYATVSKAGEPLVTYLGYEVTTGYSGTNTTNNGQLRGELRVTDAAELATLTLDTASSPSFCRTERATGLLRLICDLPQLRSGTAPVSFQVFFRAPSKVDGNGTGDVTGTDFVSLTGATVYAEQSDGAGNTNNSSPWLAPPAVTLGTSNPTDIKSVLPKSGGKLYTGNGGIASQQDLFGTSLTVPAYAGYTKTTIPVQYLASSISHRTTSATSCGLPARCSAVLARMMFLSASDLPASGHKIAPGAMPLTRTSGASSFASDCVIIASAAFAMQ